MQSSDEQLRAREKRPVGVGPINSDEFPRTELGMCFVVGTVMSKFKAVQNSPTRLMNLCHFFDDNKLALRFDRRKCL